LPNQHAKASQLHGLRNLFCGWIGHVLSFRVIVDPRCRGARRNPASAEGVAAGLDQGRR
jgi:hypothetical protein